MRCNEIVPGYVLTLTDALPRARCEGLLREAADRGWTASTDDGAGALLHQPRLARQLWQRIAPHVPATVRGAAPVGLHEHFGVYRQSVGDRFPWHSDAPVPVDSATASRLSLLLFLNDDYRGGQTLFRKTRVHPRQGCALLFRHELEHQPAPLLVGTKYVLRADVLYRQRRRPTATMRTGRHP